MQSSVDNLSIMDTSHQKIILFLKSARQTDDATFRLVKRTSMPSEHFPIIRFIRFVLV